MKKFSEFLLIGGLLTLFMWMSLSASREKSPTFDEIAHITKGYVIHQTGDFRLSLDASILPQYWAALPLRVESLRLPPPQDPSWIRNDVIDVGRQFFFTLGNDVNKIVFRARTMMVLVAAALGFAIYLWSKCLFGITGGLISLSLYAFCPSFLAHGSLVTTDVPLALLMLISLTLLWHFLNNVHWRSCLAVSLAVALLLITKLSGLLILPMAILLFVLRCSLGPKIGIPWRVSASQTIGWAGGTVILVVFFLWAFHGFKYSANPSDHHDPIAGPGQGWASIHAAPGIKTGIFSFAQNHKLLPEQFLYGVAFMGQDIKIRRAFLNGGYSVTGWWYFFPYCFIIKTPLPVLLLLLLALGAVLDRLGSPGSDGGSKFDTGVLKQVYTSAPLWAFSLMYGASLITSSVNIGHRHLLPIYPPLFILAGSLSYWIQTRRRWMAPVVLLLIGFHIVDSVRIRPHYLAFFNQIVGGPREGYRYLVDSSLDWGQDLPGLKRWLHRNVPQTHPPVTVFLSYFGTSSPSHYGIDAESLPGSPDIDHLNVRRVAALRGGIYCISATMLQSVYLSAMGPWAFPYEKAYEKVLSKMFEWQQAEKNPTDLEQLRRKYGEKFWNDTFIFFDHLQFSRLCAYLRKKTPDDNIGYSILIYRLTDEEVRAALYGQPAELVPDVRVKGMDQWR